MRCIVAVDRNWGIGVDNHLLVSIPADMRLFRQETQGKVVVMGRRTLESFPGGMPLKGRKNIVLTRNKDFDAHGAVVVGSLKELAEELEEEDTDDVYCIGGESVYRILLPYCDTAHVTRINFGYAADRYFPNLEEDPEWEVAARSEEQTYFDLDYEFVRYERVGEAKKLTAACGDGE